MSHKERLMSTWAADPGRSRDADAQDTFGCRLYRRMTCIWQLIAAHFRFSLRLTTGTNDQLPTALFTSQRSLFISHIVGCIKCDAPIGRGTLPCDKVHQSPDRFHFLHLRDKSRCLDDLKIQAQVEILGLHL